MAKQNKKLISCYHDFLNQIKPECLPLSLDDYKDIIRILTALPLMEIQLLAADENIPIVAAVISKSLLEDVKKGSIQNLEKLIDRAFGKESMKQDADAAKNLITQINISSMPNAETHFADKETGNL